MPIIELKLSDRVYQRWQKFLATQQADGLARSGLLGDWVALSFLNNVNEYLKKGGPPDGEDEDARRQRLEAEARRKLSKPQKRILPTFNENDDITVSEAARVLGILPDEASRMLSEWVDQDFLAPAGQRNGDDAFTLSQAWQERNLAANRPSLNAPRMLHITPTSKPGPGSK